MDFADDVSLWADRVMAQMESLQSLTNRDIIADNMISVANQGVDSANRKADEQFVSYTEEDTLAAREFAREYVENRVDALYGSTPTGVGVDSDVRNPWLEAGVDAATALSIAYLLRKTLRGNQQDEQRWRLDFAAAAQAAIVSRAALLTWDNLGKSFANGVIGFVSRFLPVYKTWLETTSRVPRDEHLAVVGETVPFNDRFSHGQFWSQESINCKCGVDIQFGQ